MRKNIIVGNWKMNNGPKEGHHFLHELESVMQGRTTDVEWAIAAPFISMTSLMPHSHGDKEPFVMPLAAQNFYPATNGAYTGETSLEMLQQIGVGYAIIGHSERREYFGETNDFVNAKIKYALSMGVTPIMAFGETLEQFEKEETLDVLKTQLKEGLVDISSEDMKKIVLAYEPIWAIGTGKTATPEQAQDVCSHVRTYITELYDEQTAAAVRIQYGGSVNPENIKELMSQPDIDGALVGGASLNAESFMKLITYK